MGMVGTQSRAHPKRSTGFPTNGFQVGWAPLWVPTEGIGSSKRFQKLNSRFAISNRPNNVPKTFPRKARSIPSAGRSSTIGQKANSQFPMDVHSVENQEIERLGEWYSVDDRFLASFIEVMRK
jgi:hypothetical protein